MFQRRFIRLFIILLFVMTSGILTGCELLTGPSITDPIYVEARINQTLLEGTYDVEDFDLSILELELVKSDGSIDRVIINASMISSGDQDKLLVEGIHEITVTYLGMTTSFTVNLIDGRISDDLEIILLAIYDLGVEEGLIEETYEQWKASIKGADGIGIKSATINASGQLVLTLTNNQELNVGLVKGTDGLTGPAGKDGLGIKSITINDHSELVIVYTNDTSLNLGVIVGANGQDGVPGEEGLGFKNAYIDEAGELILVYDDDTSITVGPIVGIDGKDGVDGVNGIDGKDGVDGVNGIDGQAGLSAYQIYLIYFPDYQGDEEQWIFDLIHGRLVKSDTVAPVLYGVEDVYLYLEDDFDPLEGVSAFDNVDGWITITYDHISGTVNLSNIGVYALTYTVTDAAGNTTTHIRLVYVLDPNTAEYVDIVNGTFDEDAFGWRLFVNDWDGSEGILAQHQGELIATIHENYASEVWHIQILQDADALGWSDDNAGSIQFHGGYTYKLTFDARSTVAGEFKVSIGNNTFYDEVWNWVPYLEEYLSISYNTTQNYEIIFTLDDLLIDYNVLAQLKFELGLLFANQAVPMAFVLDNVQIEILGYEELPHFYQSDFSALHASTPINDLVYAEGYVAAILEDGVFLYDGEHYLAAYTGEIGEMHSMNIGDFVRINGYYTQYYSLYEIGVNHYNVISSNHSLNITYPPISLEALYLLDFDDALAHSHGYQISGVLYSIDGEFYITDGTYTVRFYEAILEASKDALYNYLNSYVTLNIHLYCYDSSADSIYVAFHGGETDITVDGSADEVFIELDIQWLLSQDYISYGEDLVLYTVGPKGTVFSNWESSAPTIMSATGQLLTLPLNGTTLTLTATATLGELTEELVITVTIYIPEISKINSLTDNHYGNYVTIEGVIYFDFEYGMFINDGTGNIFVEVTGYIGFNVGQNVKVIGRYIDYEVIKALTDFTYIGITGNTYVLPEVETYTLESFYAIPSENLVNGSIITLQGIVHVTDTYGLYLMDYENQLSFVISSNSSIENHLQLLGKMIEVDVLLLCYPDYLEEDSCIGYLAESHNDIEIIDSLYDYLHFFNDDNVGNLIKLQAIVYDVVEDGLYIYDGSSYAYIAMADAITSVYQVGINVHLEGTYQNITGRHEVINITAIEIVQSNLDLPTPYGHYTLSNLMYIAIPHEAIITLTDVVLKSCIDNLCTFSDVLGEYEIQITVNDATLFPLGTLLEFEVRIHPIFESLGLNEVPYVGYTVEAYPIIREASLDIKLIENLNASYNNEIITVEGVVYFAGKNMHAIFLYDGTGFIIVQLDDVSTYAIGDIVTVIGVYEYDTGANIHVIVPSDAINYGVNSYDLPPTNAPLNIDEVHLSSLPSGSLLSVYGILRLNSETNLYELYDPISNQFITIIDISTNSDLPNFIGESILVTGVFLDVVDPSYPFAKLLFFISDSSTNNPRLYPND